MIWNSNVTAEPGARTGPSPLVRTVGRAVNSAVARFPRSWRLFRGPVRRFFDSRAAGWDERVRSESAEYLMPLKGALDRLPAEPARVLDIGTGTGAAALELANRYPDAEVVGIDVSPEMVAQAGAKATDLSSRAQFLVADIASFEDKDGFDLITMVNMPPFFDRVVALLRPGGFIVNASSYGSRTPFFTPPGLLKRGFERRSLRTIATGRIGLGTYYIAKRD
jgi:SAM-dependent methyltransferase